jgi:UDP-4-amino-4,6-dideoxy-N-acetyl-beta-L-altrosamine transaminase
MKSINYGQQSISQSDVNEVVNVLKSDFLTQGPMVPKFEKRVSEYCSASFGIATCNATSALHIACLALDVKCGDVVWTTPITFVSSANCALFCGASIDFIDIDPQTYNMSVERLRYKLQQAEILGKLPKVVIPVHLSGQSCDMEEIFKLSKQYGFKIIEDASHAIGGKYKGQFIGGCSYSDITIFSFHPVKIITTGEGGMAMTNSTKLAQKMYLYRGHGITSDPNLMHKRPDSELWNYQQIDLGFNYRMTDIQAALGISQLKRIDEFIKKRHEISKIYNSKLKDLHVTIPYQHVDSFSSYHLYLIRLSVDKLKINQKDVYLKLHKLGVKVNLHYIPVYLQPFYQEKGFKRGYCPEAEKYYSEVLSIPIHASLNEDELDRVISSLVEVLR